MFDEAKRADKRLNNPPVSSVIKDKDNSYHVDILNISRRGLRFRSSVQHTKGDKILFGFSKGDDELSLSMNIRGKIVNDYPSKIENAYEYGVKFSSLLHWYEMSLIHNFVYALSKRQ